MPAQDRYDVAVIGAGQAGLTMGYELAQQNRRFVILDTADSVGAAWRTRWDSLTLFTPRRYDSLPGLEFPGDPDGYPGRDELIAYLESYAETFDLPVQVRCEVRSVGSENGAFRLELANEVIEADQVVVATGPFQVPRVPSFTADLDPKVVQTHSVGYRNPGQLPDGPVLVVGGGEAGGAGRPSAAAAWARRASYMAPCRSSRVRRRSRIGSPDGISSGGSASSASSRRAWRRSSGGG